MSSLKFNVQHKEHRERAQPANRRKWGLLEKHKDYVLRARDFHSKEAKLKILREKASLRNPDEFYFAMHNARTNGKGSKLGNKETSQILSADQMKLLRSQDDGYLTTLLQQESKAIERLKQRLAFTNGDWLSESGQHDHDTSDLEHSDSYDDDGKISGPRKSLAKRKNNSVSPKILKFADSTEHASEIAQTSEGNLTKASFAPSNERVAKLLKQHEQRKIQIESVLREAQLQRQLLTKGPKRKIIKNDGSIVYKWAPRRKR
ncbi:uncharacterized protein V1516DRAFT_676595 [Lipomyces oligophaga]|uniref:uncharacterized protein n=1 Tax=Lipomyces oligophaga TaxID=45792 RepID=UPI0034CEB018